MRCREVRAVQIRTTVDNRPNTRQIQAQGDPTMKIVQFATAVSMLVVPALVSAVPATAQTITQNAGVSVHRGIDTDAEQRRVTRTPSGVTVYRGQSASPAPKASPVRAEPRVRVRGGDNLWVVDTASGEVVGCDLRRTAYGTRRVRCSSDR